MLCWQDEEPSGQLPSDKDTSHIDTPVQSNQLPTECIAMKSLSVDEESRSVFLFLLNLNSLEIGCLYHRLNQMDLVVTKVCLFSLFLRSLIIDLPKGS